MAIASVISAKSGTCDRTSPVKVIATILEALILGKLTSGDRVIFFLFKDLIINKYCLLIIKRAKTTEIR